MRFLGTGRDTRGSWAQRWWPGRSGNGDKHGGSRGGRDVPSLTRSLDWSGPEPGTPSGKGPARLPAWARPPGVGRPGAREAPRGRVQAVPHALSPTSRSPATSPHVRTLWASELGRGRAGRGARGGMDTACGSEGPSPGTSGS